MTAASMSSLAVAALSIVLSGCVPRTSDDLQAYLRDKPGSVAETRAGEMR